MIICGYSGYPRDINYAKFREICDSIVLENGEHPLLLADIAHISGLVASKLLNNPFDYCDVVTSTTHKTLRGPRSGLIFFRKGFKKDESGQPTKVAYDLEEKVNFAVFPSLQGGPHDNVVAGVAVALREAATPYRIRRICRATEEERC